MNLAGEFAKRDNEFEGELRLPRADIAIIGGGMAGVAFGRALTERMMCEREHSTPGEADGKESADSILNVKSVRMLLGGKSLAYSPVHGEFSDYLTLAGSDRYRRDHALNYFRSTLVEQFQRERFDLHSDCFATEVRDTDRGTFRIAARQGEGALSFESKRLVLALGHALREVNPELRDHIILGGGDLCERLQRELDQGEVSREACLDKVLSRFRTLPDRVVHIGVVGLGATTIEVLKVLESLLDKDEGVYRTARSLTPIKITVFDSQVFPGESLVSGLCEHVRTYLRYLQVVDDQPNAEALKADISAFKEEAEARIRRLAAKGHIDVVPNRLDWASVSLEDGIVMASDVVGNRYPLSCIIDCAPFVEGISTAQKSIIDGLGSLRFVPTSVGVWKAEIAGDASKKKIALLGAAFSTKRDWGAQSFEQEAQKALAHFYPATGTRT